MDSPALALAHEKRWFQRFPLDANLDWDRWVVLARLNRFLTLVISDEYLLVRFWERLQLGSLRVFRIDIGIKEVLQLFEEGGAMGQDRFIIQFSQLPQ